MKIRFAAFILLVGFLFAAWDRSPWASHQGGGQAAAAPKSSEQVWQEVAPSLIYISARQIDGKEMVGSGFVILFKGQRFVLTNRHVVKGAEKVFVGSDPARVVTARGYKIAADLDLAIIECPAEMNVPPLHLARKPPQPGAEVMALGFPLGLNRVITRGIVSGVDDEYVLFDAPISSGNSGGPLVNQYGEVIAVVTLGSRHTDTQVVQNLNVGIRMTAIPALRMFQKPVTQLSAVSGRIREVERFIERGYLENDYFGLLFLLMTESVKKSKLGQSLPLKTQQRCAAARKRHGDDPAAVRKALESYVKFLKQCESRIDQLPNTFAGLGNDSIMKEFLHAEPILSFAAAEAPPNASVEMLPQLARISADHWLARVEDHRFRVECVLQYSDGLPFVPLAELEAAENTRGEKERPAIRLRFSVSGNREEDFKRYLATMQEWRWRSDVMRDWAATFDRRKTIDPVRAETVRGTLLGAVANLGQTLAAKAAQRGEFEAAITLIRRDLMDRPRSSQSGELLGEFLALTGRFDEAWDAFTAHYEGQNTFDPNELKVLPRIKEVDLTADKLVRGFSIDGLRFDGFLNHPTVLENARKWNAQAALVDGIPFSNLPSLREVVTTGWFGKLNRLSRIRILHYYRSIRPQEEAEAKPRAPGPAQREFFKEKVAFDEAIQASEEAQALWDELTSSEEILPFF